MASLDNEFSGIFVFNIAFSEGQTFAYFYGLCVNQELISRFRRTDVTKIDFGVLESLKKGILSFHPLT